MLCHRTIRSQAAGLVWHARFSRYRTDEPSVLPAGTYFRQNDCSLTLRCFSTSAASPLQRWTREEEQELVALRKRGIKWSQMKFYLEGERSTRGIMAHFSIIRRGAGPLAREARDLTREKREGVPVVAEDVRMAVQLRAEGLTAREIDERIGKGHGALRIGDFIRDPEEFLNPQRKSRYAFTPQEDTLLAQLVSKKFRWSEIAKHFPSRTVRVLQSRWINIQPKETAFGFRGKGIGKKVFTREETEKLLNMYKQGLTTKAIAESLDCTSGKVRSKLSSLGLVRQGSTYVDAEGADKVLRILKTQEHSAPQRVTLDEGNQMREMSRSGKSVSEIALALHRHTRVVKYWLSTDGNPRSPNQWTHEEEAKVSQLHDDGKDAVQIAEQLGRTKASIEAKLHVIKTRRTGGSPLSHRLPWTPEEENRLVELYLEGKSSTVVGNRLGRTQPGVDGKIVELRKSGRIPPKRPSLPSSADTGTAAVA